MSTMTNDVKDQINQLVKINQALVADLDVSNRIASELGHERDQLKRELNYLRRERDQLKMQLQESLMAMKEIHLRLLSTVFPTTEAGHERRCALDG